MKADATAEEARRRARRRAPQRGAALPPRRRRDDDRPARLDRRLRRAGRGQALPPARERQAAGRRAPRHPAARSSSTRSATTLAQQKQEADAARAAAADEKAQLDELAAQQQPAPRRRGRERRCRPRTRRWVAAIAQHDEAEAALAAESQRIAELAQSAGDGPALGDGTFIRPVPGGRSPAASATAPIPVTGATAFHAGIDFGAPCGTPIKAAGTGVILSAGFNGGGYGNMTLINHGNGLSTLYGHQSSIIVVGRPVGDPGPGDRLRGFHRQVDRVPPALRGARRRQPGRPDRLPLTPVRAPRGRPSERVTCSAGA